MLAMKKDIHPKYNRKVKVRCITCGAEFETGSTLEGPILVEICSNCHPFYTGKDTVVDTENLIARYQARQKTASKKASFSAKKKAIEKKKKSAENKPQKELTLKDMLSSFNQ